MTESEPNEIEQLEPIDDGPVQTVPAAVRDGLFYPFRRPNGAVTWL